MATNFVPFQQSSLFSNIAGGGGQPIGAVPMDFAKATPYVWNPNPVTPDPEVPEDGFDMEVFCSMPANSNHPMCTNVERGTSDYEKRMEEENKRDYFSIKKMKTLDDKDLINYLKDGWLGNSKFGFLPRKGNLVTVNNTMMGSPLLKLAFGKQDQLRRDFIIEELTKRGFLQSKDKDGNFTFNIDPRLYEDNINIAINDLYGRQDDYYDSVPVIQDDGTVKQVDVNRTGGKYYQQTRPKDTTGSRLTKDDGTRDDYYYQKALKDNIVRSVKNTNPKIKSRYSKSLGGFTGGK